MREINVANLLNSLTSYGISIEKFEMVLNEDGMPAENALAVDILKVIDNYTRYAINNNFKKHENNIKKLMDLYEDAKHAKNDRKLATVKSNLATTCQKLPKEYVALGGADYVSDHVATIANYVDQYIMALEHLKASKLDNVNDVQFLNESIQLLEDIKKEALLLWDTSSQGAIDLLEGAITSIKEFGKVAASDFLVMTRLAGLRQTKEGLIQANEQYLSSYYQIIPGKKINTSLIVLGTISNDPLTIHNLVRDKKYEYDQFHARVFEEGKKNEQAEAMLAKLKSQKEGYIRQVDELYQKLDNGLYPGTTEDFDTEIDTLEMMINDSDLLLQTQQQALKESYNPVMIHLKQMCIKLNTLAYNKPELFNYILDGIDFVNLMPALEGNLAGADIKVVITYIQKVTVVLDSFIEENVASAEEVRNKLRTTNEVLKPKSTNIKPKTPEQNAAEEAEKAKAREERRKRLLGQGGAGTTQTPITQPNDPITQTQVKPLVNNDPDPIDND